MKLKKKIASLIIGFISVASVYAQDYISKVWVADLGNGYFQNPIIDADYSDPDICRVGDDFFMISSSFNCIPGLPILHSKDLVNWTIVNYALPKQEPEEIFKKPQHGDGVWAPSIRFHKGEFYVYWGDPDQGIFMVKTKDPFGKWEKPVLVKKGKGLIDSCPLWDEDGKAYLVHAYAGSRAGFKSILAVAPMSVDGTTTLEESRIVYDGHLSDETVEGPKFYKRGGYYYIFAPAGGVSTGWQLALRSKSPYGPFERKVVLAQGKTTVNGPHQGGWVETQTGENWFIHFQDKEQYGRVVHLQPMKWVNDWPQIGDNIDSEGCGYPVKKFKKPNVGKTAPICTPQESDEFTNQNLGLQWQWHGNYQPIWYFCDAANGLLRMFSVPSAEVINLWDCPNLLLQKTPTEEFVATTKIQFYPSSKFHGEKAGIVFMGEDYASLYLEKTEGGIFLIQAQCTKAPKGTTEKITAQTSVKESAPIYLRMTVKKNAQVVFSYSSDNKNFTSIGDPFAVKQGKWIGAKIGLYINRPLNNNDGGWMDTDWFRITKY